MLLLQNRQSQKTLLNQHHIPTSPWVTIHKKDFHESDFPKKIASQLGSQLVLKTAFGGYDGYGTFMISGQNELRQKSQDFAHQSTDWIAEKKIPFLRELAVIVGRSRSGQFFHLPLVETIQKNGRCQFVRGPVSHSAFPKLLRSLSSLLDSLQYVGVMGVELFDQGQKLLVNELAPRVHNSGHYSQQALSHNQFRLHLMAGLDLIIPPIHLLTPAFVMTNILGQSTKPLTLDSKITGVVHLYGKVQNRDQRKMGHINYTGKKIDSLFRLAQRERKDYQK